MISMWYGKKEAHDFEQLVKIFPPDAFSSPLRSIVPLVDFWRTPEARLRQLDEAIGVALRAPVELHFEYPVPVQCGRGKASFTDLMITTHSAAVAIEAKFTEPRGEIVRDWLGNLPEANRKDVLEGWMGLIRRASGAALRDRDVMDLPYQLIHRTASVCFLPQPVRAVVYQVFGPQTQGHYVNTLSDLWQRLGRKATLEFHVISCPLESLPVHEKLADRWKGGERQMEDAVRRALLKGPLFSFGKPARQFLPG